MTFLLANYFILTRTTSIPRSSEAFSYRTKSAASNYGLVCPYLVELTDLSISLMIARADVVLPQPGGPVKSRLGMPPR